MCKVLAEVRIICLKLEDFCTISFPQMRFFPSSTLQHIHLCQNLFTINELRHISSVIQVLVYYSSLLDVPPNLITSAYWEIVLRLIILVVLWYAW